MLEPNRLKIIAKRIAMFGGVCTVILINTVPFVINDKIRKSDHYKQVMQLLSNHPEAVKYLGLPIRGGHINVINKENYGADEEKMWLKVPVSGSKAKGNLYYDFFFKKNDCEPFQLSRIELTVDNVDGYKLLIKKS